MTLETELVEMRRDLDEIIKLNFIDNKEQSSKSLLSNGKFNHAFQILKIGKLHSGSVKS